jgi:nitrite reductase/ring-hydroxylating ferredoxin subunit
VTGAARGPEPDAVRLPAGDVTGRATFEHGGRWFVVFVHDGRTVVLDAACPHRGGPLGEGLVRDGAVVCPWHWYAFDLATGECRNAAQGPARRHPVVEIDGVLHALIMPSEPPGWAERLRAHARGVPARPDDGQGSSSG